MTPLDSHHLETPEEQRTGNAPPSQNFMWAVVGFGALIVFYWFDAEVRTELHLMLGLLQVALAGLPSLLWLRRGRGELPIFEVLMLTGINTYALPLLNGHQGLEAYSDEHITRAAFVIVVFQIAALVAYTAVKGPAKTGRFWREDLVSGGVVRWMLVGMALSTAYIVISTFTHIIPFSLQGILRAVFYGIGIVSTFVTARRLGTGKLAREENIFFVACLSAQCFAMAATLFLVGPVSLLLLALVGYVSGSQKIPFVTASIILLTLAVLHNGKSPMREKYWDDDLRTTPKITELPAFFSEWISHGVRLRDSDGDVKLATKLIDRTSLFHIMCLVVAYTPEQQPYLEGETYKDIPAQFVPRILWANKPPGHVSTSRLSVYYGLQTEEDTNKTTIGFGMLAEAYANFGIPGMILLGAFLGTCIKKIQCWGTGSPMLSPGGLVLVILLAWSFQTEFTLSMWLSSLFQACVAVLVVPISMRTFFPE